MSTESRQQRRIEAEKAQRRANLMMLAKKAGAVLLPITLAGGITAYKLSGSGDTAPREYSQQPTVDSNYFTSPEFTSSLRTDNPLTGKESQITGSTVSKVGNTTIRFGTFGDVNPRSKLAQQFYLRSYEYSQMLARANPAVTIKYFGSNAEDNGLNTSDVYMRNATIAIRTKDVAVVEVSPSLAIPNITGEMVPGEKMIGLTQTDHDTTISIMRNQEYGRLTSDVATTEGCQAALEIKGDGIGSTAQEFICNAIGYMVASSLSGETANSYRNNINRQPTPGVDSILGPENVGFGNFIPSFSSATMAAFEQNQPFNISDNLCYPLTGEICS